MEIEYRGYDPLEALNLIQTRQFQEYEQFKNLISQLKFKLQSEDYNAWKRCLSEYEREKASFLERAGQIKQYFFEVHRQLRSRNLNAAQYQHELQNLFQQFESQFTPSVESFKYKIKDLFDTIRDDNRRRKWWKTVEKTQITTGADGRTTRTSLTQINHGVGGHSTGSFTHHSQSTSGGFGGGYSQGSSFNGGVVGGSSSVSRSSSFHAGFGQGGSSGFGQGGSNGGYGNGGYNGGSQQSSGGDGSSNYDASSQQRKLEISKESKSTEVSSGQSGYSVSAKKEVKKEESAVTGSMSDNSKINFSSQTRTGLTDNYGGGDNYGRKRRSISGEFGTMVKTAADATFGDSRSESDSKYHGSGSAEGGSNIQNSASVQGGSNIHGSASVGGSGQSSLPYRRDRRHLGLLLGAAAGKSLVDVKVGGGGAGYSERSGGIHGGHHHSGYGGYQGGSAGFQGGSAGFQGGSGGFQGGSGGFQAGSAGFQAESSGFRAGSAGVGGSGGYQGGAGGFQGSSGGFQAGSSSFQAGSGSFSAGSSGFGSESGGLGVGSSGYGSSGSYKAVKKYSETSVSAVGADGYGGY